MKVLFIGGTGIISSACSRLAVEQGIDLYLLNRGKSSRPAPDKAKILIADIYDPKNLQKVLIDHVFDVVVNWIAFTPEHIENDLRIFSKRTGQYIFISTATVYQTPPQQLPIKETTPLSNPIWGYSQQKIACEERLIKAYNKAKFPVTIVRPSHTYDRTMVPLLGRYTSIDRMRKGKKVIVHGDGTSLWTLTHHKDFAVGFNGLLGNAKAIGEAFHITSDELLSWNQIYEMLATAANTKADIVHVPSEIIARFNAETGAGLLGDKAHSKIFDNTKIRQYVPDFNPQISFSEGAREIMSWFDKDSSRQVIDKELNQQMEEILKYMSSLS